MENASVHMQRYYNDLFVSSLNLSPFFQATLPKDELDVFNLFDEENLDEDEDDDDEDSIQEWVKYYEELRHAKANQHSLRSLSLSMTKN